MRGRRNLKLIVDLEPLVKHLLWKKKMETVSLATLSPGDDTVARWAIQQPENESAKNNMETQKMMDDIDLSQLANTSEDGTIVLHVDEDALPFENAQKITTQDLQVPETMPPSTWIKATKRYRRDLEENNTDNSGSSENVIIPPWIRAENDLRLAHYNTSQGRKVLKTCYNIPDSDCDISCYNLAEPKAPFFVRIVCSSFDPQKVVIGRKGQNIKKCEFTPNHLDSVVTSLTSIVKGSKSKTVNLGKRGEKLKMEMSNGCLNFAHTFPSDIKKFVQKNNMNSYIAPDDVHFNIPSSEIENLMDSLIDSIQFLKLKHVNSTQRKTVFDLAVRELKHYQSMSTRQYAIKLFEIYYKLDLLPTEKYPISVIFPEYYKLFSNVF